MPDYRHYRVSGGTYFFVNAADKKWLFLVLAWLFEKRTDVSDPLSEVEAIYA
ncbi:MAG: DUF2247 family protein, partial [Methylococcales bacterium]